MVSYLPEKEYVYEKLVAYKVKDPICVNTQKNDLFINLSTIATALGLSINTLLEFAVYDSTVRNSISIVELPDMRRVKAIKSGALKHLLFTVYPIVNEDLIIDFREDINSLVNIIENKDTLKIGWE